MEAGDAQRGGEGERPAELLGRRHRRGPRRAARSRPARGRRRAASTPACRRRHRCRRAPRPSASAAGSAVLRPGRPAPARSWGWRHSPTFLAAVGGARLAHHRRQRRPRCSGPTQRNALERLVREVERVALVDEHVVGDGREHHPLDVGEVRPRGRRSPAPARPRRPTGSRRSAGTSRPACSRSSVAVAERRLRRSGARCLRVSRLTNASAWTSASGRSAGSSVGEQVGHGDEHREPGAPTLASR